MRQEKTSSEEQWLAENYTDHKGENYTYPKGVSQIWMHLMIQACCSFYETQNESNKSLEQRKSDWESCQLMSYMPALWDFPAFTQIKLKNIYSPLHP